MSEQNCRNCRFFDWTLAFKDHNAHFSFCNRHPPIYTGPHGDWQDASEIENWTRPLVSEVEFCGEWQPAPPEETP